MASGQYERDSKALWNQSAQKRKHERPCDGLVEKGWKTLKKTSSLQDITAKAHARDGRQTVILDCLDVFGRGIALRLSEMVLGIFRIELNHKLVTSHLGDDGGGGKAGDLGVCLLYIARIGNGTRRSAVHAHAVGREARVGNRDP